MTEDDARAILAEVEPKHAARERDISRILLQQKYGAQRAFVDVGDVAIAYDAWRPRATRTPSGWSIAGGWLDVPVPELPTRGVPNAGGVWPYIAGASDEADRDEVHERRAGCFVWAPSSGWRLPAVMSLDDLRRGCDLSERELAEMYPGCEVRLQYSAAGFERCTARGAGSSWERSPRGWCVALGANKSNAKPGTLRGWYAMRAKCAAVMRTTDAAWAAERAELTQRTGAA